MSVKQLESAIRNLSLDERRELAEWFDRFRWENETSASESDLSSPQIQAILHRRTELETSPDSCEPVGDLFEKLRKQIRG
ncbi:MAG: hypothetical protein SFY92_07345 [Verrucomicrobiae bacterium]|nr:hypothetical protein [Verrucomicrobiae bacterium]